ncbi:MAG: PTS sugar transporter subunit IIB [Firmicutes bacterium]|jgi:PTS system ascorbate-specific IIB component|nr:PTS sugar transporter subunit IIB [Bacillota bacterium]
MRRLSIAVVCGAGLGTSLMAKMAVDSYLREKKIPSRTECSDVGSARSLDVDILITTTQLAQAIREPKAKQFVVVGSFLNREELRERLSQAIANLENGQS